MGMYSMIEDANNKRLDELMAKGMTEDEAVEFLAAEQEVPMPYIDPATLPPEFNGIDPR